MLNRKPIWIVGCCLAFVVSTALCSHLLYAGINERQFSNRLSRQAAIDKVMADRKATIEQLEKVVTETVNDPAKADTTKSAMLLLGQLHADEAVPLLVQHIAFSVPRPLSVPSGFAGRIIPVEDIRPSVAALSDIGLPALPQLLTKQMATDDPEVDGLTYSVLIKMLGTRVAQAYVQQAVDNQTDKAKRQRLISLRDRIAGLT